MASSIPQTPAQKAPPRFHSLEYWAGSPNEWQLDVLHDFPSKLKDAMKIHLDDRGIDFERKLRRASYLFIYDAVAELEGQKDDTENWERHHKIFYKWMKSVVERGKAGTLAQGSEEWSEASPETKKRLVADLVVENAAGALTCRIGRKLANIVRGEIAPLELMMEGNLLHDYYQDHPRMKTRAYKHLRQIAELYSVKHPDANVMEIGAGTGGATAIVLEAFEFKDENGSFESLLGHFDFTDISLGFFKTARLRFVPWTGLMDYKTLDITSDPVKQSFLAGSYDLIVASAVLHATPNLNKTLNHVRKLLKPGGKLLMVEFTQDSLDTQLIFGTLPGWWLGEEQYRKTSPNVPIETWDKVLRATGFSGVDVEMRDCEQSEFQSLSIILTTAADLQPSYPLSISIVDTSKYAPQAWLNGLQEAIQAKVGTCHITRESFEDLQLKRDTVFIFLSEMATPFLDKLGNTASEKLRSIMLNSEGILWLSCNSIIDTKQSAGQAQCLLRAMQQEDSNKRYVELDFEAKPGSPWSQDKIPHIVHVLQQNFNKNIGITDNDQVYAVKNSILYVPRIYPAPEFLSALLKATSL